MKHLIRVTIILYAILAVHASAGEIYDDEIHLINVYKISKTCRNVYNQEDGSLVYEREVAQNYYLVLTNLEGSVIESHLIKTFLNTDGNKLYIVNTFKDIVFSLHNATAGIVAFDEDIFLCKLRDGTVVNGRGDSLDATVAGNDNAAHINKCTFTVRQDKAMARRLLNAISNGDAFVEVSIVVLKSYLEARHYGNGDF